MLYAGDEEVAEALVLAGQVLEDQGQREQALVQYREVLAKHEKARYAAEAQKRITALGSR
jgi:TolA-binding protein